MYSEFQNGITLMNTMGSFWNLLFSERDLVRSHCDNLASEYLQTVQNITEMLQAVSKDTVPVFHREFWYPLTVKQSDLLSLDEYMIQYEPDTDRVLGDGSFFGQTISSTPYAIPLPEKLVDVAAIHNRILNPTLSLIKGDDYTITDDAILLSVDVFNSNLVAKREIIDSDGNVSDYEITLWAQTCDFDWNYLWSHYGYVLGIIGTSSDAYKQLLDVFWTSRVLGNMTTAGIRHLLSAVSGIPIVIEPTETVIAIDIDPETLKKRVVTDANIYKFPVTDTISVYVGQILHAGDLMADSLLFEELSDANSTIPSWMPAVPIQTVLPSGDATVILWPNRDVAVTHRGYNPTTGKAIVDFEMAGNADAIDEYWDAVHAGEADMLSVARLLDVRGTAAATEPGPASIPATINPAEWAREHLIGNNAFIAKMRISGGLSASGVSDWLKHLRSSIPAHVLGLLFFEINVTDSYYGINDLGTVDSVSTDISVVAEAPVNETLALTSIGTESVSVRAVAGNCVE